MANFYDILGVKRTATKQEILAAYRKLVLKYHPDRNGGNTIAAKRFIEIKEAYEILADEKSRREYDLQFDQAQQKTTQRTTYQESYQETIIRPTIEYFRANTSIFYPGIEVTFEWHVRDADMILIDPFGIANEPVGKKTIKLKHTSQQYINFKLRAGNSKHSTFTSKHIVLENIAFKQKKESTYAQYNNTTTTTVENSQKNLTRMGRMSYFKYLLLTLVITMPFAIFFTTHGHDSLFGLVSVIICIIFFPLTISRLHDINLSGWFSLTVFIPHVNLLFIGLLLLLPGSKGENKYGKPN